MKYALGHGIDKFHITHVSIPIEIYTLFLSGTLTAKELLLVATIDSMVNRFGKGCYASNNYLGCLIRISPTETSRMISRLRKIGLLFHTGYYKRRRMLETAWSNNPNLRIEMRQTLEKNAKKKDKTRFVENHKATLCKTTKPYDILFTNVNNMKVRDGGSPLTFEEHCCQYMKDAIHSETRRIVKWKIKKQACHIKAIANQYKDKEEFLDIFEWYCQNIGNTKEFNLPVCYSPKELRNPNVWNWIENKRTKYDKKNKDVPITDEAKTICKTLNMMHWPKGSKEQLPKLVQLGLNEYTTFVKRLKKYFKELEEGDLWYFYVHHLIRKLPAPSHFIENWFRDLNSMVRSWDKWNGDLAKYGFTLKQEHFLSRLRGLTVEYGRKGKDFDTLMEKVMNEN
jgi:hypothetical protein